MYRCAGASGKRLVNGSRPRAMVKTWHNPKLKAVPPPVLDDALGDEPLPAPVKTEETAPPVRLDAHVADEPRDRV